MDKFKNYILIPSINNQTPIVNFNWEDYIDKVYIMSIPKNIDKAKKVHQELNRIGINDEYIIENYNINNPLYKYIYSYIYNSEYNNERDFNILFNYYETIKRSYELGYGKIMICEDDIRFLKDIDLIKKQIIEINFEEFDWVWLHKGYFMNLIIREPVSIVSSACCIYNRKAMKLYIDYVETQLGNYKWEPNDLMHINISNCNKAYLQDDICICINNGPNGLEHDYRNTITYKKYPNRYQFEDYNNI